MIPLPSPDTTPPVTKTNFAIPLPPPLKQSKSFGQPFHYLNIGRFHPAQNAAKTAQTAQEDSADGSAAQR